MKKELAKVSEITNISSSISIEFKYSECTFQGLTIPHDKMTKFYKVTNIKDIREIIGKYFYVWLSDEVNPMIKGIERLEPDVKTNELNYLRVIK